MVHLPRSLFILAGLAGLFWPNRGVGQTTPSSSDAANETISAPRRLLETPPSATLPPSPNPLLTLPARRPSLLDEALPFEQGELAPAGQTIGWFANIDAALIKPHIESHLNSGSNIKAPFLTPSTPTGSVQTSLPPGSNANVIAPFGDHITLPIASLNWTGSPFIRLGYRFANGAGDVRLDYREVASQGTDTITNFDAAGAGWLKSRLNVQRVNLTYGTSEFLPDTPTMNRLWAVRFGLSAADVFFDSQARGQQVLLQTASNSFGGVGPTVGFQFHKPVAKSRVSLYGELDGTGLVGFTRQHFSETVDTDNGPLSASVALRRQSNGVGIFGFEGGASYAPWDDRLWRFTLGYQWQRWWWAGATSDSNAALTLQGFFLRGEWRY